jgi:hypothetical protein
MARTAARQTCSRRHPTPLTAALFHLDKVSLRRLEAAGFFTASVCGRLQRDRFPGPSSGRSRYRGGAWQRTTWRGPARYLAAKNRPGNDSADTRADGAGRRDVPCESLAGGVPAGFDCNVRGSVSDVSLRGLDVVVASGVTEARLLGLPSPDSPPTPGLPQREGLPSQRAGPLSPKFW